MNEEFKAVCAELDEANRSLEAAAEIQDVMGALFNSQAAEIAALKASQANLLASLNEMSWTGKGTAPKWLNDLVATGKTREDFLIGTDAEASGSAAAE